MSIQIGDINLTNEIIELHFQVLRTQMLLEKIVQNSSSTYKPNQSDVRDIEERALQILNQKFPNMGIAKKNP
jgi:hypothetical protein